MASEGLSGPASQLLISISIRLLEYDSRSRLSRGTGLSTISTTTYHQLHHSAEGCVGGGGIAALAGISRCDLRGTERVAFPCFRSHLTGNIEHPTTVYLWCVGQQCV